MTLEQRLRDQINDYESSIQAIIGFVNFYIYDDVTRTNRPDVKVFQGRAMRQAPRKKEPPRQEEAAIQREQPVVNEGGQDVQGTQPHIDEECTVAAVDIEEEPPVTPDLGVCGPGGSGVLGEVKLSFPKERQLWLTDFEQLMKYDRDFMNWPTDSGTVIGHDVVLITHQSRSVAVQDFAGEKMSAGVVSFRRPVIIIECNRSEQGKHYYFFRKVPGTPQGVLSEPNVEAKLKNGVQVPMNLFVRIYSMIKLYDAEPPLPYMMQLIWEHVVLPKVRTLDTFARLRRGQKIETVIATDEIIEELREGFSFRALPGMCSDQQPSVPHRSWVIRACEQMVSGHDAEWVNAEKTAVKFFFQRFRSVLGHFIEVCTQKTEGQTEPADPQRKLF